MLLRLMMVQFVFDDVYMLATYDPWPPVFVGPALGTCQTLLTNPEQSAPQEPLWVQLGQLPEQLPLEQLKSGEQPDEHQLPPPQKYENPMPDFARQMMSSRLMVGGAAAETVEIRNNVHPMAAATA